MGDSLYWGISTTTTVGYGDIKPEHTTGKIIACVLMAVGIGFVAIITGAIAQRFLAADVEEVEAEVLSVEEIDAFVLKEVREIADRLQALEATVERRLTARN